MTIAKSLTFGRIGLVAILLFGLVLAGCSGSVEGGLDLELGDGSGDGSGGSMGGVSQNNLIIILIVVLLVVAVVGILR